MTAAANNKTAYTKSPPVAPTPPFISFKPGTVEIKSAWRPLNKNDQPARFHVQTVRFYEKKGPNNQPCYFEQQWGLIALHIIQKTPSAPAFIYATFEQTDNIRQPNGTSVEDADGNVIQPIPGAAATTPALAYKDSPTAPKVTATGPFCTPQNNLYFKDNPNDSGLTGGGAICVNQRYEPIPPDVIAVNKAAHQAIAGYNTTNGVASSPWPYYKLVSVQASPFDISAISPSNSIHGPAVFYQANIVVETNYTLQQFQGRISSTGAPTALGGLAAAQRRHAGANAARRRRCQHGWLHGMPRQRPGRQRYGFQLHPGRGLHHQSRDTVCAGRCGIAHQVPQSVPSLRQGGVSMALTSFAAVQKFFNDFIAMNPGIDIADAQHHAFWNTTYDNFVNGNVPNVTDPTSGQPLAILNKVNGKYDGPSSNIVMALAGTANSLFDPNNPAGIGQMPQGGPYMSTDQINELSDWITAGCPE